jgi:hypothetical protein
MFDYLEGAAVLSHIGPALGWNHINLTGDYVWSADKRVAKAASGPLCRRFHKPSGLSLQ